MATSGQQLVGLSARKEKNGLTVITAKFFANDYASALGDATPLEINGLARTSVSAEQEEHGKGYVVTAVYEGGTGNDGSGASYDDTKAELPVYEWSPSFEQVDILTHPKIEKLLEKYQGRVDRANGTIEWPEKLYNTSENKALFGSNNYSQSRNIANPMLGVREYLSLGGIWSKRSVKKSIPDTLFSDVGKIVDNPPNPKGERFPSPGYRFWLTMPPAVTSRGDMWEITERWMLSGVNSGRAKTAAKDIYTSLSNNDRRA